MSDLNSESMRLAVQDYADRIAVPEFDERRVTARAGEVRVGRFALPRAAVAIATAAAIIAVALNGRAVVAQVEQMMRAVLTVNGANVPATIRAASLQEAQRDMPFTIIAPPQIPGYRQSIEEVVAQTAPQSSRLLVQYTGGSSAPTVTIMESSATASAPTQIRFWSSKLAGAQPPADMQSPPQPMRPPMTGAGPQEEAVLHVRANGGGQQFRVRLTPQSWTAGGTRIDLLTVPGALTTAQLEAIRREMSR